MSQYITEENILGTQRKMVLLMNAPLHYYTCGCCTKAAGTNRGPTPANLLGIKKKKNVDEIGENSTGRESLHSMPFQNCFRHGGSPVFAAVRAYLGRREVIV